MQQREHQQRPPPQPPSSFSAPSFPNNNNNNNNNNKNNNNNSNRNKSWGTAAAPREHRKADSKVQKKGVHGCEIKETGSGVKKKGSREGGG